MNRYYYSLLTYCILLNAQLVEAQFIAEIKQDNGQLKIRYHIRQNDTFCIEKFYENGSLQSKSWHNDSAYSIQPNQIFKKEYGIEKKIEWFDPFVYLNRAMYRKIEPEYLRDSVLEFYPDGKHRMRCYYVENKQFTHFEYLPNGQLYASFEFKKWDDHRFQWQYSQEGMVQTKLIDTARHCIKVTLAQQNRLLQEDIYQYQNVFRLILELTEQSLYDKTGQKIAFWKRDTSRLHPDKDNGSCLYGMRDPKEEWSVQPQYESIDYFNNTKYLVNQQGKYGLMDELGQFKIPCEWDDLANLNDFEFKGFSERDIETPFEPMYQNMLLDQNTVLRCRKDKLYGVIDVFGKIILQPIYQNVRKTKYNLYEVKINGFWGLVDANQQIVVKPNYDELKFTEYDDLFITVDTFDNEKDENVGLINRAGKTLLPCQFSKLNEQMPYNRYFTVNKHGKEHTNGLFHAERGWIIDTTIELSTCNHPEYTTGGKMKVDSKTKMLKMKYGILSKVDGAILIPIDYQQITSFETQKYRPDLPCKEPENAFKTQIFFLCKKEERYGIFDPTLRKWTLPVKYDYLRPFGDSLLLALEQGKWQCINAQGQSVFHENVDAILFDLHNYGYDLNDFYIQKKNTVYRIDNQSFPYTTKLQEKFYFSPTHSLLNAQGDTLVINEQGKIIVSALERVIEQDNNYFLVQHKKSKLQYSVDNQGNKKPFLLQYEVQNIQSNANLMLVADTATGRLGATTLDGQLILPCVFFGLTPKDEQKIIWGKKDFPMIPKAKLGMSRSQPIIWDRKKPKKGFEPINIPENGINLNYNSLSVLDGGWQMYDSLGQLVSPTSFDYPFRWQNHLGIGQIAGKQGLWNAQGKMILPAEYDKIVYHELNKMFHLFRSRAGEQQVYFADADGQLVTNVGFKNMSYFYGDWAFVETEQGYGMIQKNGQYWIKPQAFALQQTPMSILDTLLATKVKLQALDRSAYGLFNEPYSDIRGEQDVAAKQWTTLTDKKQRTQMGNLMLERVLTNYFLHENDIYWQRQNKIFFSGQNPFFILHESDYYHLFNRLTVMAIASTEKGMSLAITVSNYTEYSGGIYHSKTPVDNGFCENFKLKNNIWKKQPIDSVLIWNEATQKALNQLLFQKISALKNQSVDCGNPEKYWERVQYRFFILPEGLQFYMPRYLSGQRFDAESIPILLTWAELKPYLSN